MAPIGSTSPRAPLAPLAPLALLALCAACAEAPAGALDGGAPTADAADEGARPDAGPASDAGAPPDAGPPADGGDPTAAVFDRDHLLRVELDLPAADWDALRAETRTLATTIARPECLDVPFASPYTWYSASARLDGVAYASVGVRKKGFLGSLSDAKPSLKLALDRATPGAAHHGVSTFTLNNAVQDPSLVKACIALDVFRAAGVPAARCSFAEVRVNGASLGVYVNVEPAAKPLLRRWFASDEGQLYEGTLSDLRAGWLGTFEQKTNEDVPYDRADLAGLTAALEASDDQLFAALEPWLDVDAFLRFWATEVLVDHWDGYAGDTNNFYLYHPPGERLRFIPSGLDGVLGSRAPGGPASVLAVGLLARRLYLHPTGRARYLAEVSRLLHEVWDAPALVAEVDRAARVVAAAVPRQDRAQVSAATEALRGFLRGRASAVQAELDRGVADWTEPLRDRPCFEEGRFDAELRTTFGTHPAANIFATGTGTFTATIAGRAYRGVQVGAAAGFGTGPDDAGDAVLALAATTASGVIPIVYVAVAPELFHPGPLAMDGARVRSGLLRIPRPGAGIEFWAAVWTGGLELREASTDPAAPISVAMRGELLVPRGP